MSSHRMFRVIVLGGVALVDCGARTDLGRRDVADAAKDASADVAEEDVVFSFPPIDATPVPDVTESEIVFPPAEANAPPPSDER